MSSATVVQEQDVPQPTQHGKPGGLIRHLNVVTAVISGIVLAAVFRFIADLIVPAGTTSSTFAPVRIEVGFLAMLVGWVLGFMIGIGAFIGPLRWLLGRDLTHVDAEFMAGKGMGVSRYFRYTTDHKVVGIQYLVGFMVIIGLGGLLAMLIRTELGVTWAEVFSPDFYNTLIGTHGIAMVIAMIIAISGPVGNFIVPIMIGTMKLPTGPEIAMIIAITMAMPCVPIKVL